MAHAAAHLASIRDRLPHGQWLAWLDDNAPFSRRTAANYIELTEWSRRVPAQFTKLSHLGPGKLYVIATAPAERVKGLRPGKMVPLPGSERRKTIEAMTTVELETLVGGLATPPAATDPPIEKVVQGVRFKVAALGAAADVMLTRIDEVDRRVAREIRAELVEVLARIDDALQA